MANTFALILVCSHVGNWIGLVTGSLGFGSYSSGKSASDPGKQQGQLTEAIEN